MPNQKPGTARNRILKNRATLSMALLGRSALRMATGMPTIQDSTTDSRAISAVSGPRRAMVSATLSERKNEWPNWPRTMSSTQCQYCSGNGSFSPSADM